MIAQIDPSSMVALRKYAYLLFALPLAFPVISMAMADIWGHANAFAWGTVILVFVVVPSSTTSSARIPSTRMKLPSGYAGMVLLALVPHSGGTS
jgi:hypothetical protein